MKSKIISAFSSLSNKLDEGIKNEKLLKASTLSCAENTWFDMESVDYALKSLSSWLNKETLIEFTNNYSFTQNPKTIAVICAGNIPAVGFHDMLCVLLSGNKFYCKLSSSDKYLLPAIADLLIEAEPLLKERIEFAEGKIENFDAVIATGSNNTTRYFDYYFGKYPNIIRHSRSSISVLDSSELSQSNAKLLIDDVLTHKGQGCRNVSKIFIPKEFDFTPLIEASKEYAYLLDHNKYRNNYDYHKAIFIMNNIPFIDSGVLLFFESKELFSPVSVLNYEYYENLEDVISILETEKENLQCVVSNIPKIKNSIPLGKAQEPTIYDFADNVDTMKFLNTL